MALLFKLSAETKPAMPRSDPASLKWDNDGELSSQDTFNWVQRLTQTEDERMTSDRLQLSSRHFYVKQKRKP